MKLHSLALSDRILGIRFIMYSFHSKLSGWIKSRDEIHSSQPELLMRLTQEEMFAMFAFPSLGSGMSVVRPHSTCLSLFLAHRTMLSNLSPHLLYVSLNPVFEVLLGKKTFK